jgi:hypothetical protein
MGVDRDEVSERASGTSGLDVRLHSVCVRLLPVARFGVKNGLTVNRGSG